MILSSPMAKLWHRAIGWKLFVCFPMAYTLIFLEHAAPGKTRCNWHVCTHSVIPDDLRILVASTFLLVFLSCMGLTAFWMALSTVAWQWSKTCSASFVFVYCVNWNAMHFVFQLPSCWSFQVSLVPEGELSSICEPFQMSTLSFNFKQEKLLRPHQDINWCTHSVQISVGWSRLCEVIVSAVHVEIAGGGGWLWILCSPPIGDYLLCAQLLWRVWQCRRHDERGWYSDVFFSGLLHLQSMLTFPCRTYTVCAYGGQLTF